MYCQKSLQLKLIHNPALVSGFNFIKHTETLELSGKETQSRILKAGFLNNTVKNLLLTGGKIKLK
jgi:hypothetical protein